jgi:hypothetical protein
VTQSHECEQSTRGECWGCAWRRARGVAVHARPPCCCSAARHMLRLLLCHAADHAPPQGELRGMLEEVTS